MVALEHAEKARTRVESAIVMQSLVRRFLARVLTGQASLHREYCFSHVPATLAERNTFLLWRNLLVQRVLAFTIFLHCRLKRSLQTVPTRTYSSGDNNGDWFAPYKVMGTIVLRYHYTHQNPTHGNPLKPAGTCFVLYRFLTKA